MGSVGAIAEIISLSLKILDKYIDDPKRRLRAQQDYIDECKRLAEEILNETDAEKLDKLLLDFIDSIHTM